MTHGQAAALICSRCRAGSVAILFAGTLYFYHGNPFIRCDATPIWADGINQGVTP